MCFRDSGEVKYVVRAESASDPSGGTEYSRHTSIGSEDQASRPVAKPVERNEGLAQSDKDEAELVGDQRSCRVIVAWFDFLASIAVMDAKEQ